MESADIKICNLVVKLTSIINEEGRAIVYKINAAIKALNDATAGELLFVEINISQKYCSVTPTLSITAKSTTDKTLKLFLGDHQLSVNYAPYRGGIIS